MKKVIKMTESQLKKLVQDTINEQQQSIGEYHDEFNDDDDDYNELDSLFKKNFDTEDDYDGEMLRGDDEGFSNKMREKHIYKHIKKDPLGIDHSPSHYSRKKDVEIPRDSEGNEVKYSPLKSDDLPLNKYLEKKKMGNLDEDEDIAMLDNLFKKD